LALVLAGLACGIPSGDTPTATSGPNLEATLMQITIDALQNAQPAAPAATVQTPANMQAPVNTQAPAAPAATATFITPMLSVSVNTNCRFGPGLKYPISGTIAVGGNFQVVATAPKPEPYVIIRNPGGGADCWAWLEYSTVTGDTSTLPILSVPQPPVGSISGFVWLEDCHDTNPGTSCVSFGGNLPEGDGIFSGEPGISGVTAQLFSGACPPTTYVGSATTNSGGTFIFDGLVAGKYCIKIDDSFLMSTAPLGGIFTFPSRGNSVQTVQVDLLPGENKSGFYSVLPNTPQLAAWVPKCSKIPPEGKIPIPVACCGDRNFWGFASLFLTGMISDNRP